MVLLDTSALLFLTIDPIKLTSRARKAISEADRLIISSISIWEIAQKVSRGKIEIGPPLKEYVEGLYQLNNLEILSVDVETWLLSAELDWPHRDPADRVIVATAMSFGCPLITSDRAIGGFYAATVW